MFAVISPSEAVAPVQPCTRLQRSEGEARLEIELRSRRSVVARQYQRGSAKVRFPHPLQADVPEAVLLNTAGGITGGDRFTVHATLASGTSALITTQAAEKVYRSLGEDAYVDGQLHLGQGARLEWLPQEAIVFDQARLSRRLDVDMAEGAEVLALEAVVLGRTAMGERVREGRVVDRCRVRRAGRLVFADTLRLDGAIEETLSGHATGLGAKALATVLFAAPHAATMLGPVREILEAAPHAAGASCWNDLLVARLAAPDGQSLLHTLIDTLVVLRGGAPLPRMWHC